MDSLCIMFLSMIGRIHFIAMTTKLLCDINHTQPSSTTHITMYKLVVERVYKQNTEDGKYFLTWYRHICYIWLNSGPGIGTETCKWTMCFLLRHSALVMILNDLCSCTQIVDKYLTDGVRNSYLSILADVGGDCLWWVALSGHWLLCNGCIHLSTSVGCFCPMGIRFWTTAWIICNGPPFYHIYIINRRAEQCRALQMVLAAFGTMDEPFASCMLVHFWVCVFKMTVGG